MNEKLPSREIVKDAMEHSKKFCKHYPLDIFYQITKAYFDKKLVEPVSESKIEEILKPILCNYKNPMNKSCSLCPDVGCELHNIANALVGKIGGVK